MLVGALPTGETNQNCTPLFSVEAHGCEEWESVRWPQRAGDKCGSEIFLSVTWGKLEGKVTLLLVTVISWHAYQPCSCAVAHQRAKE